MPGGNWNTFTILDPGTRPGFYANFIADAIAGVVAGEQGVVCIPVTAPWGPVSEFVTLESEADVLAAFSDYPEGNAYFSCVEALRGGANQVLAYRLASSAAAKASLTLTDTDEGSPANIAKLEARYPGARGNQFAVTIQTYIVDSSQQELRLLDADGTILFSTTFPENDVDALVEAVNTAEGNAYITAEKIADGDGTIANVSAQSFSGGNSGISGITNSDYISAHSAMETREFQVYALPVGDDTTWDAAKLWTTQQRADGNYVTLVYGATLGMSAENVRLEAEDANHEGIVFVGMGATRNGTTYAGYQMAPHIAGMIAGAGAQASITHAQVRSFDDVETRLSNADIKEHLRHGVLTLVHNGEFVMVEKGINTLTNYSQEQNERFSKIRVISTIDSIATALRRSADANWIGKIDNDENGRKALIGAVSEFLRLLSLDGIIRPNYEVREDPDRASYSDKFFLFIKIWPVDSIDYIYTTISIGN